MPTVPLWKKIETIYQILRSMDGVMVDPCLITSSSTNDMCPLWVIPIQNWYDGSLSFSEEHCDGFLYWPWVDFIKCLWPKEFQQPELLNINEDDKDNESRPTNHNP